MTNTSNYGIADLVVDLGVSRETAARLQTYGELLTRWQRSINLVGPRSLPDMWRRHFLDSAQIMGLLPADRSGPIYDVGAGAGFPGLVLSVLGVPGVVLIESDGRKCAFLREVARETGADAQVLQLRLGGREAPGSLAPASCIVARGLAPMPKLLDIVFPVLSAATCCIFLKGAAVDEEISSARRDWNFSLERVPSRTSAAGFILKLTEVRQDGAGN